MVTASDNRAALLALVRDPLTILAARRVAVLKGLVDLMDSTQAAAPAVHGRVLVAVRRRTTMLVPASAMDVAWSKLPPDVRRAA